MFKKYFGLRGQALNYAISAIAGTDFLLFGYGNVVRHAHRPVQLAARFLMEL